MKKTIAALFAGIAVSAFAAGMNDLQVMFSTPGPDKYADGSLVLDGEYYALVYTYADGSQEIVVKFGGKEGDVVYGALNGKCQPVVFLLEEERASKYSGGSWGVYLLDTRDFENNGGALAEPDPNQPLTVNVKASIASNIDKTGGIVSVVPKGGVSAGSYDLSAIPQPVVKSIKVVGAEVRVTVANTMPFIGYTLVSGKDVKKFSVPDENQSVNGDTSKDITIIVPKKDDAQFFKVSTL